MVKRESNSKMIRLEKIEFFNSIIKEISARDKINESSIIETLIYDEYLPKHPDLRNMCELYLYNEEYGIKEMLVRLFYYLSLGPGTKARYYDEGDLIQFISRFSVMYSDGLCLSEEKLYEYNYTFETLLNYMKKYEEKERLNKGKYQYAEMLYNHYKESPEYINPQNLFQIVQSDWDYLKEFGGAYSFISALVSIQTFRETIKARRELCDILIKISLEWMKKDEIKYLEVQKYEKMSVKTISNGIIKYSDDQILIELVSPERAEHVTAVSVYGGNQYGIPNFIVTSDKHKNDMTSEEIDILYQKCMEICPAFGLVVKCQDLPTEERPTIGFFPVGDQYSPDYEVVRFEKKEK